MNTWQQQASRNKYRTHATDAAKSERKGDYQAAACHWKTAAIYAPNATESNWVGCTYRFL
ncbi:ANR family transcriptional regulator [Vibrio parahaemolyticus]|uniref:ANR family transcriptional regulator n=1 Tax=Vibrio parahaemolyticus TaxID=670 RepID=UPI001C577197